MSILQEREFSERLVLAVKERPAIYDTKDRNYKDRVRVEMEWRAIGDSLGLTAEAVKKRWQNLRGSYSRSLASTHTSSDGPPKPKKSFYLSEHMDFLKNHLGQRPVTDANEKISRASAAYDDVASEDPDSQSSDDMGEVKLDTSTISENSPSPSFPSSTCPRQHSPLPEPKAKRRKIKSQVDSTTKCESVAEEFLRKQLEKSIDPDFEFLRGLLPPISELSKARKRAYFLHIAQVLFETLAEQDKEEESNSNS